MSRMAGGLMVIMAAVVLFPALSAGGAALTTGQDADVFDRVEHHQTDNDGVSIHYCLWINADYTLVTLPDSDHWVQGDAADRVSRTMLWWLKSRP